MVVGADQQQVCVGVDIGERLVSRSARRPGDDVRFLAHERAGCVVLVGADQGAPAEGAPVARPCP